MKQDKPITKLDSTKNVVKHYDNISQATNDSFIGRNSIMYHLKNKSMDVYRNYWILTADYLKCINI